MTRKMNNNYTKTNIFRRNAQSITLVESQEIYLNSIQYARISCYQLKNKPNRDLHFLEEIIADDSYDYE